jgi:glycosyltransferase involved in cell wall biosynthesis
MHPKIAVYDPSGHGGITHYTFELAEGLAKNGCRVTIITSEDYELAALDRSFDVWFLFRRSWLKCWFAKMFSFRTTRVPGAARTPSEESSSERPQNWVSWLIRELKSLKFTLILFRTAFLLVRNGTDVVHVQWLIDRRADFRFIQLLRALRIKIVYTVHDVLPHDEDTADNRTFYKKVYQYPDKLIVHSENNRKELLELFSIDPTKICVIPHGCQSVFFDNFGMSLTTARRHLGIPLDARVILFFGLIKRYKGLEYLLKAFETIEHRCEKVVLLIAGSFPTQSPDVRQYYSTLLAEYSGHDNVRFVDGYVPVEEASHYFCASDLVVLPYVKASQSGVLLSAYAAGKPVVVTATGGLGEVVRDGESGLVVPPRDVQALAEACVRILNDAKLQRRFGREARLLAETAYSWTAIGARTVSLYQSLVLTTGTS